MVEAQKCIFECAKGVVKPYKFSSLRIDLEIEDDDQALEASKDLAELRKLLATCSRKTGQICSASECQGAYLRELYLSEDGE